MINPVVEYRVKCLLNFSRQIYFSVKRKSRKLFRITKIVTPTSARITNAKVLIPN